MGKSKTDTHYMNNIKLEKTGIIWLKLKDKLLAFALSFVQDKEIAEDIVQEVFVRIHSKIDTLRDETRLKSWIYQITRNLINDYFRKEQISGFLKIEEIETDGTEISSEIIMNKALIDMIEMMDNLPPEYCEALCLTELGTLTQKEYAEKKGISYSGAKSRVQRARQILKDMLVKCCHYEFDKYGIVFDISPKYCCCCKI